MTNDSVITAGGRKISKIIVIILLLVLCVLWVIGWGYFAWNLAP